MYEARVTGGSYSIPQALQKGINIEKVKQSQEIPLEASCVQWLLKTQESVSSHRAGAAAGAPGVLVWGRACRGRYTTGRARPLPRAALSVLALTPEREAQTLSFKGHGRILSEEAVLRAEAGL